MVRKLQEMKDSSSGFESTTGKVFYFDDNQDSPGNYDLVNLNVSLFVILLSSSHLQCIESLVAMSPYNYSSKRDFEIQPGAKILFLLFWLIFTKRL